MQTYNNWQQSPVQGAIPSPVDPLSEVENAVRTALPWLEQAYCLMNSNRLDGRYSALYTAICDGMTATREALDHLEDAPDDTPGALAIRAKEPGLIEVLDGELDV